MIYCMLRLLQQEVDCWGNVGWLYLGVGANTSSECNQWILLEFGRRL
jgi:hypothetical protein